METPKRPRQKEQSMSVVLVNAFEVPDRQEEKFLADW
jgi:hypothetical protein